MGTKSSIGNRVQVVQTRVLALERLTRSLPPCFKEKGQKKWGNSETLRENKYKYQHIQHRVCYKYNTVNFYVSREL